MIELQEKRKQMIIALKKLVVPEIKILGFSGTFPHFRKQENDDLCFVSFQFGQSYSSKAGNFVVEFRKGKHSELPEWSKALPFHKLTAANVSNIHRLVTVKGNTDAFEHSWFNYNNFTKAKEYENLAVLVKELLPQGASFFKS